MLRLTSPSFPDRGTIPRLHAADGDELSPALAWVELPRGTASLALLMEDADAHSPAGPGKPFLQWLVYNVQPSSPGFPLGANQAGLPGAARSGRNDHGREGYSGPAADFSPHRYVFRLLALDVVLDERELGATGREQLLAAAAGHVLETAELTGTYYRQSSEPIAHRSWLMQ